jgi:hypothetical protein
VANSFERRRLSGEARHHRVFAGRVHDPQFDPLIAFGYMGDYIGSATDGTNQYFAWGDNRDAVTNFMCPHGRDDPDVFIAKQ